MERRSVSFPDEVWKRIKEIAAAKPHYTENAIIIDLVLAGYEATQGPAKSPRKRKAEAL